MNTESVRNLLLNHVPFDEQEAKHASEVSRLLELGENAWNRLNTSPGHLTASAFVIDPRTSSVALIFHGKLKRWLQPGGHVEKEDLCPLAAARRELLEETGMETPHDGWFLLDIDIHWIPERLDMPSHRHYDLRFARILDEDTHPSLLAADDAVDALWMPLPSLLESGEDGLRRCFLKLTDAIR